MSKAFKDHSARFNDNSEEDTIELELRPEYMRALARIRESAANSPAHPVERRAPTPRSHLPPVPRETSHATDVWVSLTVAAVLGITALVVALWPSEQQDAKAATQSVMPAASAVETFSGSPTHAILSEAQPSPMRFANPFDASEIFEFPAGTTEDAARETVAEVLLERARERRSLIDSIKHARRSTVFSSTPIHRSGALCCGRVRLRNETNAVLDARTLAPEA